MTLVAVAVMVVTAVFGARLVEACEADARVAHAQAVADAVALAGVWGDDLARATARRNGSVVDDYRWTSGVVTVTVSVDGVGRAASAA